MRIAIFSDTFLPQTNGVANVVDQSAKNLVNLGHQVAIFTVSKNFKNNPDGYPNNPLIISLPSVPALVYPQERLTLPLAISLNRLKKFRPDVIHSHTPFAVGWEAVLAAKLFRIPLVGTHHTFYDHYLKHARIDYEWGKKISWKYTVGYYNRCDLVLSPTQSLADALIMKGLKKPIAILQNSIDTDLFRPMVDPAEKERLKKYFGFENKSLVFMGRVSYEKSIDYVLRAFALMLKKMPGLKLMVVGDGPERQNLEKLADQLNIKNKVIFTGFLYDKELVKALQANDIFLTACKSENMPLSVLEAMSIGLPIIAVKERGLAEIIKNETNGLFVKTDDPTDMAQKTLNLLCSPKTIKKFGNASRSLVMEYSHKKVSLILESNYKKLLTNKNENLSLS